MHHKAEDIIEQTLQSGGRRAHSRVVERFFLRRRATGLRGVCSALSWAPGAFPGTSLWRSELVRDALDLDDVEIRDAAVQAAELWGDRDMLPVLKSHSEPEPWLRDYICDVIDDLGE